MNDVSVETIRRGIRAVHACTGVHRGAERVVEAFEGETVWEGEVLVFELVGHPEAERCYAWETDGEVVSVLAVPPVVTARDAVRASILADEGEVPEA